MITSELVSNSIKYAFPKVKEPKIAIELHNTADKIIFSVHDNGKGMTGNGKADPE
jgi:two-component sensor histidine kinase